MACCNKKITNDANIFYLYLVFSTIFATIVVVMQCIGNIYELL